MAHRVVKVIAAAAELRSRLGRRSRRAWPRRIAVLAALLAVIAAVPAFASTRDYSGSIAGGGTITIKATFKDGKATKVKITWSDVPTTCDGSEIYASTTSGTISGKVVHAGRCCARAFVLPEARWLFRQFRCLGGVRALQQVLQQREGLLHMAGHRGRAGADREPDGNQGHVQPGPGRQPGYRPELRGY